MHLVYDDAQPSRGMPRLSNVNPNKCWRGHYTNLLYLEFIARNSDRFDERRQAEHELGIARRKLTYWERQPDFSIATSERDAAELKRNWTP